jgi:hypothetical protein
MSVVYGWFSQWRNGGLFEKINHAFLAADAARIRRAASPITAVLEARASCQREPGCDDCRRSTVLPR